MKKTVSFLFALLSFGVSNIFAQTPVYVGLRINNHADPENGIYVSPNGDDNTATGAIDHPYKSINAALTDAAPGSTIILRGGTYYEHNNVRIRKSNITIKSAKNEWAIIDLPLEHDPDTYKQSSTIRFDPGTSDCKLQAVEVIGGFYAVCFETKWNWGGSDDWMAAKNIIVEDCKLHHSRNDVIKIKPNCDNITIRYNEIHHSGQTYIDDPLFPTGQKNSEGIDNVNGDNMHVHHNYIHDICSTGIYAKGGATDALIEYNRIERPNAAGIMAGFTTNLEYFDTDVNPEYYENINGIVRNNLVIDAGWEGIGLYASKDVQIYNNTVVNALKGGLFHSAIYFGLADQDGAPFLGSPPNINPNIHHNIVCQQSTASNLSMIEIRYAVETVYGITYYLSCLTGKPTMDYNCYYISGKTATFKDSRPDSPLSSGSFAQWQTHISGDTHSIETDPAFNDNYMPANTQCAGMGIEHPLIVAPDPNTVITTLLPEIFAYINNGILYIETPVAETVQLYSIQGALLDNFNKQEGKISHTLHPSKNTIIIIRGSSGWVKKLMVQ